MKKNIFFTLSAIFVALFLFSASAFVSGKVITVCNNSISAGQYTSLASAITAANAGDTLYVMGSPYDYGSSTIYISKRITLIGAGYNPVGTQFGFGTQVSYIQLQVSGSSNAAGTKIMGISSNSITGNDTSERNVTISRCFVSNQILIAGTNWLIENNIAQNIYFNNGDYTSGYSNYPVSAIISNNFVISSIAPSYQYGGYINGANILINHNIIEGNVYDFYYTVISNNIFFHGDQSAAYNVAYNTYTDNITVYSSKDSIPQGSNTGTGNIYNPAVLFVNGPSSAQGWSALLNYNWALLSSSPGHNAASDGTDIGIYGGSTPVVNLITGTTTLPQLTSLNVNNSVTPVGGKLNINFKARTQN